jgi:diacylglycerol kinase family enzyme
VISVNGCLFSTCGGTNLAAAVAARANQWKRAQSPIRITRLLGRRLYAVAALREFSRRIPRCSITLDCPDRPLASDALALFVSNQPRFGGWFTASPTASNEDGYLDLCLLPRPRGLRAWGRVINSARRGDLASLPGTQLRREREVIVTTSSPVRFFGDGEILLEDRVFDFRVLPRAAQFVTPAVGGGS